LGLPWVSEPGVIGGTINDANADNNSPRAHKNFDERRIILGNVAQLFHKAAFRKRELN